MNASIPTFIRNPKIEWSGDLCSLSPFSLSASLRTSFVCVSVCVWTRTSQVINSNWLLLICIFLTVWCRTGLTNLTKVKVKEKKCRKLEGKEKEKKEKKHTNSIARIRARASPPTVSFACVKLHNAVKKKKIQDMLDLWILCHDQSREPPSHTSHSVSNANKGEKVTLIVQISFAEKNESRRERDLPKLLFFNGRLSWCSICAASSPTNEGK